MTGRRIAFSLAGALVLVGVTAVVTLTLARRYAPSPQPASESHGADAGHAGAGAPAEAGAVFISPARQQLIGVRSVEVGTRTLSSSIRAVGTVTYDETRVAEVHTKTAGWAETTPVDFVGKAVSRGAPLFTVYSPDLVASQKEYLLALRELSALSGSSVPEARESASRLVDAARERLRLWDLGDDALQQLEATGQPRRTVTIASPVDGVVLERKVVPGQYVTPELAAYRIADLRALWVVAQVYEDQLGQVRLGDRAEVTVSSVGAARPLEGRVTYVYPDIDPATRRARVRVELAGPAPQLKLDSFVDVVLRGQPRVTLAVPSEAVIDTGVRRYVILARAGGYFLPALVTLDAPVDGLYPVVSGLKPGDRVVTSAQFLIDSESNLATAIQSMAGMDMEGMDMPAKPDASHGGKDERR